MTKTDTSGATSLAPLALDHLNDRQGRPLAFLLTPGQADGYKPAEHLLDKLSTRCLVHADRT